MMLFLAKIYKALHLPKNLQLLIMRFTQDLFLVGATGIIFNDRKQVLLFKHSYRSHSWSLPGGYLKKGEHPREAIEREIQEESGFIVSIDESMNIRTDRESARLDLTYIGAFIGGEFKPSAEVTEFGFFDLDTLPLLRTNQLFLIDEVLKSFPKETKSF